MQQVRSGREHTVIEQIKPDQDKKKNCKMIGYKVIFFFVFLSELQNGSETHFRQTERAGLSDSTT